MILLVLLIPEKLRWWIVSEYSHTLSEFLQRLLFRKELFGSKDSGEAFRAIPGDSGRFRPIPACHLPSDQIGEFTTVDLPRQYGLI